MSTFFIEQFGCRATQADAAALEQQLRSRGYLHSENATAADVVVVNTCTVTAAADLQARQAIRTIHRENPQARIVVTGCYAQRAPEELAALVGVTWVVGNSHKPEIPNLIETVEPLVSTRRDSGFVPLQLLANVNASRSALRESEHANILIGDIREQTEFLFAPVEGSESGHTRPVLKIQDGCDSRCSYCVIPLVRGRSRSLDPDRVVEEVRRLSDGGAREVVLSGIDLGNYGRDLKPPARLSDTIARVLKETSVERLRISSIEPLDVIEDLLSLFANNDRMARHFHMPLQSGSDRILAAMRRWYRAEHYVRRAEVVREWLPDAAIGADVIAGFPGETENDHRATLALIAQLPLTYLHVFSYSARPGTSAAELGEQVPAAVIGRRAKELRALGEKKKSQFRAAQAGRKTRVLTLNRSGEDESGSWTRGLSGNYLDVRVAGAWPSNQFIDVQLGAKTDGPLSGTAI